MTGTLTPRRTRPPAEPPVDPRIVRRREQVAAELRRRRRRVAGLAVATVVVVAGLVVAVRSPLLDVEELAVTGTDRVAEVRRAGGVDLGDALVEVDASEVRRRLMALPWVASARVQLDWPRVVRVAVTEEVPLAVLVPSAGAADEVTAAGDAEDGGSTPEDAGAEGAADDADDAGPAEGGGAADGSGAEGTSDERDVVGGVVVAAGGRVLGRVGQDGPGAAAVRGLPTVAVAGWSPGDAPSAGQRLRGAVAEILVVVEQTPAPLRPELVRARLDGAGSLSFDLPDGGTVRFGPPEDVPAKLLSLHTVLGGRIERRCLDVVDVREPLRPTVSRRAGCSVPPPTPTGDGGG